MKVSMAAMFAEFLAMTLFVIIGCGTAGATTYQPVKGGESKDSAWVLEVSLAFGVAIMVLAYTFGHISGAQINCAVSFGLVLAGALDPVQGLANFAAQMMGSVFGASILCFIFSVQDDFTGALGANGVGEGFTSMNALVGEIFGTFLLVTVVLQTAVNTKSEPNRALACLAIGFAVFLAHCVLVPVDGCSINPTRSFGPALVAQWRTHPASGPPDTFKDMWIFWLGPLLGAAIAAVVYRAMVHADLPAGTHENEEDWDEEDEDDEEAEYAK